MNPIADFFKKFNFLRISDLVSLYKISSLKSVKAGETIATEGEHFPYIIGIRKGLIRTYIYKPDGEEKTVRFAKEGDFCSCALSMLKDQPSSEYLEALEDCKLIYINTTEFKKAAKDNIRLLRLWNNGISEAFLEAIMRIEFFVTLSPEERYEHLIAESPELLNRVQQKFLASYIGVTTVSLSRIRSRLSKSSS